MKQDETPTLETVYPVSCSVLDDSARGRIRAALGADPSIDGFPDLLKAHIGRYGLPEFLPELARLERAFDHSATGRRQIPPAADKLTVNPTVTLIPVSWSHLSRLIQPAGDTPPLRPQPGSCVVMIWKDPQSGRTHIADGHAEDLLALKLVAEQIDIASAARLENIAPGLLMQAIHHGISKGLLLSPPSKIRRDFTSKPPPLCETPDDYLTAGVFTLQWHITQACDLHCRHCYDRSDRPPVPLNQGIAILDDFFDFCVQHHVRGQVTFTGGNPLLYPDFAHIYQAADERGFAIGILGNPSPKHRLESLLAIRRPVFFQVSLEGLEPHNDWIRGEGHFQRTLEFLNVLRDLDIYSMVMLTLTRDNIDQVLPLAEILTGRTNSFTFNRLSMVGEGANLMLPDKETYQQFLQAYTAEAETNPMLHLKDNLINIVRYQNGQSPMGGCTGFGCGAAFNFLTLLPDGEVHACRKFPSYLGNIFQQSLSDIYDSDSADRYRRGSDACRNCRLRRVCRGCLATAHSFGLDIFTDRDPHCFLNKVTADGYPNTLDNSS